MTATTMTPEAKMFNSLAARMFEQEYLEEISRVQRFGGDLTRARQLYRQWHAYREATGAAAHAEHQTDTARVSHSIAA